LFFCFSNISGEQQANNAFYNCIDSAPDIPERGKMVPLGLDMVFNKPNRFLFLSYMYFICLKGISVGKRSAGVSSSIGRHNLNDEELVNKSH